VATEEEREALIGFGINEAILAEINQQPSQSVAELVHGFGQWLKILLFLYWKGGGGGNWFHIVIVCRLAIVRRLVIVRRLS
jgi:hypothetical protein